MPVGCGCYGVIKKANYFIAPPSAERETRRWSPAGDLFLCAFRLSGVVSIVYPHLHGGGE
jgi:hypothetical protein